MDSSQSVQPVPDENEPTTTTESSNKHKSQCMAVNPFQHTTLDLDEVTSMCCLACSRANGLARMRGYGFVTDVQSRRPFIVGTENRTFIQNCDVYHCTSAISEIPSWDGQGKKPLMSVVEGATSQIELVVIDEPRAFTAYIHDKKLKVFNLAVAQKMQKKGVYKRRSPIVQEPVFPNKVFTASNLMIVPQTGDLLVLMHMDNSVDCAPRFGRLYSVSVGRKKKSVRPCSSFGLHADTSSQCTWHFFLDYLLCFLGSRLLAMYEMHFGYKQSNGKQEQTLEKMTLLPAFRADGRSRLAVELLGECPIGELLGESLFGQMSGRSPIGQVLGRWRGMWIVHDSVQNYIQFTNVYAGDSSGAWRPTIDLSVVMMEQWKVVGKRLGLAQCKHVHLTLNRLQFTNGFLFVNVVMTVTTDTECPDALKDPLAHRLSAGYCITSLVEIDARRFYLEGRTRPVAAAVTEMDKDTNVE